MISKIPKPNNKEEVDQLSKSNPKTNNYQQKSVQTHLYAITIFPWDQQSLNADDKNATKFNKTITAKRKQNKNSKFNSNSIKKLRRVRDSARQNISYQKLLQDWNKKGSEIITESGIESGEVGSGRGS